MKIPFLKTPDEEIEKLGFIKEEENVHCVYYKRYNKDYKYTQVVEIHYKESGKHIISSYALESKGEFNDSVGLRYEEIGPFHRKFDEMVKKYKWIQRAREAQLKNKKL